MAARNRAVRQAQTAYAESQAAYDAQVARIRAEQVAAATATTAANRVGRGTAADDEVAGAGVRRSAPKLGPKSRLVGFSR
jgi:membrane protein involved in colicin uptake